MKTFCQFILGMFGALLIILPLYELSLGRIGTRTQAQVSSVHRSYSTPRSSRPSYRVAYTFTTSSGENQRGKFLTKSPGKYKGIEGLANIDIYYYSKFPRLNTPAFKTQLTFRQPFYICLGCAVLLFSSPTFNQRLKARAYRRRHPQNKP